MYKIGDSEYSNTKSKPPQNVFTFIGYDFEDEDDWYNSQKQGLRSTDSSLPYNFRAMDLCGSPEDATLGRDMFNMYNLLDAVRYGMLLAKSGYTDIDVKIVSEEEFYS